MMSPKYRYRIFWMLFDAVMHFGALMLFYAISAFIHLTHRCPGSSYNSNEGIVIPSLMKESLLACICLAVIK